MQSSLEEDSRLNSVTFDTRLNSHPGLLKAVRYHVSTILLIQQTQGKNSHEPIQELLEQCSQVRRHGVIHVLSCGPRADRQDLRDQTGDRSLAIVLQGIQSDGESSGIGCDLEVVDDTERAELADVQDGCGGELSVSFGWGDDEVEL